MHRHGTRGATANAVAQPRRTGRTVAGQAPSRFQRSPTQAATKITREKKTKTGKGKQSRTRKAPVFQPVVFDTDVYCCSGTGTDGCCNVIDMEASPPPFRCVVCKKLACNTCDHDDSMSKAAPFCVACGEGRGEEAAQRVIEIHEANRKTKAAAIFVSPCGSRHSQPTHKPAPTADLTNAPSPTPDLTNAPSPTTGPANNTQPAPFVMMTKKEKMKSGRRVKVKRSHLHRSCLDVQRSRVPKAGGDYPCYGLVVGGNAQDGWEVDVDVFLATDKTATIKGNMLTIVNGDEDNVFPVDAPDVETFPQSEDEAETVADFLDLSQDELKVATDCDLSWKKSKLAAAGTQTWTIRPDGDDVDSTPLEVPDYVDPPGFDFDAPMHENFLNKMFLDLTGTAKKLDKYLSDPRARQHKAYEQALPESKKHLFHDPDHADPDHWVKDAFRLVLAGGLTAFSGVENHWKRGQEGFMAYPDFGRYYPKNMFQLFKSGFAFCFAPEKEWYADKSDRTWNIFLPILGNWNKRHQQLMETFLLLLDESMSGWRYVGLGVHGNFLYVCAGNFLSKIKMAMVPPDFVFLGNLTL